MRKNVFLCFPATWLLTVILLVHSPLAAEVRYDSGKVQLRIAKHADYYRIVFTADEATIEKALLAPKKNGEVRVDFGKTVSLELNRKDSEGNQIRIDPAEKKPMEYMKGVLVTARPQSCSISIESVTETKTLRLSNPARLVIDVSFAKNGMSKKEDTASAIDNTSVLSDALVIDAGHGGDDKGIFSPSASESEIALSVVRDVAAALGKRGKKVTLTRKGDQAVSLDDRMNIAGSQKNALYISIHTGAGKEAVVYTAPGNAYAERSETVARALSASLAKELDISGRFDRLPGLYISGFAGPAALVELPSPLLVHYDKKMRERVLKAILNVLAVPAKSETAVKQQRPAPQQQLQQPVKKRVGDEI
ncbi:MAG: N-acetylmuramoyl-L-alanine amidase domain protein [Nitrospirae bacterium]|nr:MAG: N-acetylmuramoyl-L-alanine amidase domain protein [Nitrospirota bacterium]